MAYNPVVTLTDNNGVPVSGALSVAVPASKVANTIVKAGPGRLCRALVTVAGTAAPVLIYDNASAASGTVIGYIPTAAVAGTVIEFDMPALLGIVVAGVATNPGVTLSFS